MNVWMRNVSTSATTTRIGSSFQNVDRRRLPPRLLRPPRRPARGRSRRDVHRAIRPPDGGGARGTLPGAVLGVLRHGLDGPGQAVGTVGSSTGSAGPEPSQAGPASADCARRSTPAVRGPARGGRVTVDAARRARGGTSLWMDAAAGGRPRSRRRQRMASAVLRPGAREARPRAAGALPLGAAARVSGGGHIGNGEAGDVPAVVAGTGRSGAGRGRCADGRGRWSPDARARRRR